MGRRKQIPVKEIFTEDHHSYYVTEPADDEEQEANTRQTEENRTSSRFDVDAARRYQLEDEDEAYARALQESLNEDPSVVEAASETTATSSSSTFTSRVQQEPDISEPRTQARPDLQQQMDEDEAFARALQESMNDEAAPPSNPSVQTRSWSFGQQTTGDSTAAGSHHRPTVTEITGMEDEELQRAIDASLNEGSHNVAPALNVQPSTIHSVHAQQDAEYYQSLAQDRERDRLKREAEEQAARAKQQKLETDRRKQDLRRMLGDEPLESPDSCEIVFRLPDASKVSRRFLNSATVLQLKWFVSSLEQIDNENFHLMAGFPLKPIDENESATLQECGLSSRDLVQVVY